MSTTSGVRIFGLLGVCLILGCSSGQSPPVANQQPKAKLDQEYIRLSNQVKELQKEFDQREDRFKELTNKMRDLGPVNIPPNFKSLEIEPKIDQEGYRVSFNFSGEPHIFFRNDFENMLVYGLFSHSVTTYEIQHPKGQFVYHVTPKWSYESERTGVNRAELKGLLPFRDTTLRRMEIVPVRGDEAVRFIASYDGNKPSEWELTNLSVEITRICKIVDIDCSISGYPRVEIREIEAGKVEILLFQKADVPKDKFAAISAL